MKLHRFSERSTWKDQVEQLGFNYHSKDGRYWIDSLGLEIQIAEWEKIKKASLEIHSMGLEIVERACKKGDFSRWNLSEIESELVSNSWNRKDPSLYGRFDFTLDASGTPKLYEYNADTPTSLLEASKIQDHWCEQRNLKSSCQLTEKMPATFSQLKKLGCEKIALIGSLEFYEVLPNLNCLKFWAESAGIETQIYDLKKLTYNNDSKQFTFENKIENWIYKLYAWEILSQSQSESIVNAQNHWLEPAWKILLSSKAFMAEAWRLYRGHPNLLPTYIEGMESSGLESGYARKPFYSREGANTSIHSNKGLVLQMMPGPYGKEGFIKQAYSPMIELEANHKFTLGAWMCGDQFAGVSARFTDEYITNSGTGQACASFLT